MRTRDWMAVSTAALLMVAGAASAQPRIVSLGNGIPFGANTAGTLASGSGGGSAQLWEVGAMSVTATPLTGSTTAARISNNGLFLVSETPNEGGLGGFPTNANLTSIWSTAAPGWVDLPPLLPDPAGGITGSRNSGGLHSHRAISASGGWIVGQANTAPAGFAGFVWDAVSNTSRVLPQEINTAVTPNRYHDGRALGVSDDGSVIVGGYRPNTSFGRPVVWRWNATTMQYDWSFLDRGTDPTTMQPYTASVDNFHINAAGTKIVGTSFEFNATTMFADTWLTRWDWNAGTNSWDRVLLYNVANQASISSWQNDPLCAIPPQFIPAGMSDEGNVITGILVYSTCGSFVRGGFLWINDTEGGEVHDLYDYLVDAGTPGITDFGPINPTATVFNPPRLGWANGISSDGRTLVGYGGPQSAFGPGWVVSLDGGDCVPPFISTQPVNDTFSNCNTLAINVQAGGSGPITYQWYKDGDPLVNGLTAHGSTVVGATSNALSVTLPRTEDVGMYHVVITGACGTPATSSTVSVSIDPAATMPANDTCATATTIVAGTNVLAPAQNVCGAFVDDPSLMASCNTTKADLWYVWTPTMSGNYRIETCGSNFDTVLSVFSACDGFEIACNDNYEVGPSTGCTSNRSRIGSLTVSAGVPLYVRVAATSNAFLSATSSVNLSIFPAPAVPVNDTCAGALPAMIGANPFDTTEATNDWFTTCVATLGRDVWFVFNAPSSGKLTLATCPGTTWSTVMSLHDGCNGMELACNNNANVTGCSSQSRIVDFDVANGSDTYIRITGAALTNFGVGTLNVAFTPTPCPGDFDGNGVVDLADLLAFLGPWNSNLGSMVAAGTNGDFDSNGVVDLADLLAFLGPWNTNLGVTCP